MSLKITLSREVGSQASSLIQTTCGSCVQHLVPEAIVLFFVALLIAVEGVCDNHFVTAISVQKEVGSVLYVPNLQIAHCLHRIIFGSKRSKSGSLDRSGWISHGVCLYSF
jgi:hypothetical protein